MPIPLTPPDDEVGISIPDSNITYKGLLIFLFTNGPPAFLFVFDYVNLMTMSTINLKLCLV